MDAALVALAASAGAAVAQAAGTDAWTSCRGLAARLFRRGGDASSEVVLQRLDRTAAEVVGIELGEVGPVREVAALTWRTRFLDLLEESDDAGREAVADGLRELVDLARHSVAGVSASSEGIAIGGDVRLDGRDQAVVGLRVGNVTTNPPVPVAKVS
ncbi:hypothetical protein [Kitasatospora purpeofusca]|uniref:hypothetical protein n=1 Tax=Kitasatospora purpeofusca TaxID=67352 RepID=UPI0036739E0E